MEATPKVHRHRHRRNESRQRHRHERHPSNTSERTNESTSPSRELQVQQQQHTKKRQTANGSIHAAEEGCASVTDAGASLTTKITRLSQANERSTSADSLDAVGTSSVGSQQTVLLVNGHVPPSDQHEQQQEEQNLAPNLALDPNDLKLNAAAAAHTLESPTQPGNVSSRNSSGDAMSLRETLQQLPATITGMHRHRRTHSPQSPTSRALQADSSFHRGILGFMDRELKQSSPTPSALSIGAASAGTSRKLQSLSDPQASPAQRSLRSRGSLDKSPRRKRSKSESRRRRERKLIAAGEMEVRQANETLMRYLKQCSEMNDASLSGELEIDQNYDERRVHRKTKSQRDKRGHLISKLYTAGGLSSILKELSDDIVPAEGEEIYNPFTPVVSPTDETPAHIDKMFLQTSSGYRPVEHCYFKHSFMSAYRGNGIGIGVRTNAGGHMDVTNAVGLNGTTAGNGGLRSCGSYGDTHCLLDAAEFSRQEITTKIELACFLQRIWLLLSNICHGLLAGLALAHLLFVLSSHPMDWSKILSLAGETTTKDDTFATTTTPTLMNINENANLLTATITTLTDHADATDVRPTTTNPLIADYATFAEIYLNTFYCLTIICLVSVFDRMDICRLDLSNATELISFRWLIIAMIYIATIILTICSDSIDEKLFLNNNNTNTTLTQEEMLSNSILSVWSSLSITRSIGAIGGWIMIGLAPHEDLLYEHLVDLTKYQMTNN